MGEWDSGNVVEASAAATLAAVVAIPITQTNGTQQSKIRDGAGNDRAANVTASNELNVIESSASSVLSTQTDGTQQSKITDGSNIASVNASGQLNTILMDYDSALISAPLPVRDAILGISRGSVSGITHVNKFGRAANGIQTTLTDTWDRADAAATQQIWIAPTQARLHNVTSSSTADDGTPEAAGAGAQAVRIYGLTDWDTAEVSEDVVLNGTGTVVTSNSYVIIHRMKILPIGATYATNVGNITVTAQTDNTVTAQINIGNGQTEMSIYGIPSTQTAYMTSFDVNAHNTGNPSTVIEIDYDMVVNERPDLDETVFIKKANVGMIASGSSVFSKVYNPYFEMAGPAIIKFQATSTLADTEGVAEYDLIIVDN